MVAVFEVGVGEACENLLQLAFSEIVRQVSHALSPQHRYVVELVMLDPEASYLLTHVVDQLIPDFHAEYKPILEMQRQSN